MNLKMNLTIDVDVMSLVRMLSDLWGLTGEALSCDIIGCERGDYSCKLISDYLK